ncbi:FGGY carbohydrate kinase domain-containing protein-like isoform X2 [Dreissena polymorpha]|nr:FGGY carbohydrate kinase domain-containing protein-like isoform X2 [Dreissena polymorpha]XP_052256061.1 FGGY carbohydrate kinase domain-containing protein-like isoform X2 [Dreissena polymorpha]
MMYYFIGVDVGTASVRAALVSQHGDVVSTATKEITIWNPQPNFYQQSSDEIWAAVVETIKHVCSTGKIEVTAVKGIGFDATCSLVVLDGDSQPLSVSPDGDPRCNIIMWMDHRAAQEADFINQTGHDVLKYYGGGVSLEMEPPKLLWLKKNLRPQCWNRLSHAFDLCDFLTWRATGSFTRSLCSTVAKWTYTKEGGFSEEFFNMIGLEDLAENNFAKIGSHVEAQGRPCGEGLSPSAAQELGLEPGTPVSVGIIDAHSATLGCIGCRPTGSDVIIPPLNSRLAMISGTSTCHMIMSDRAIFVPGVWGPHWSTIIPGLWTAEGGQSAAGKLIDFVIESHPAYAVCSKKAEASKTHITDYLYDILMERSRQCGVSSISQLTERLHIWPDYHGNRSPLADHTLTGMLCGLTLQADESSLAELYLATVQALAYGTRHILSELQNKGHVPEVIYICGGLRKNQLYIQTHADVTGMCVYVPDQKESVLLGSAILGATAAGFYPTLQVCMDSMSGRAEVAKPNQEDKQFHDRKYEVFLQMYRDQRKYAAIMSGKHEQ